jgi:hypothetical protein
MGQILLPVQRGPGIPLETPEILRDLNLKSYQDS